MNTYKLHGIHIDSIELKCLVVSRGVKIDNSVYRQSKKDNTRLSINPLCCNCIILSDGTIVQLTDTNFHLRYLSGILSWNNLKLLRHLKDLATPFSLQIHNGQAVLYHDDEELDIVTFPPTSDFYSQKTSLNHSFVGNAVLQGLDWVAFQCLWPCEYAAGGQPCQFCFSGGDFENTAKKGKMLPQAVPKSDVKEIVSYAIKHENVSNVQITGGSTYDGKTEKEYITAYLKALTECNIPGETLLYITPPSDGNVADQYFGLGASRIACSLEVWDMGRASEITPGKVNFAGRDSYLRILEYIAQKHGHGKAFSNFIIGIEDFDTLSKGAKWLAERGILPTASVWMPMGCPVQGNMKAPSVDYYKRVKEFFAELYVKYELEPPRSRGLNVCIERDIWNYARN